MPQPKIKVGPNTTPAELVESTQCRSNTSARTSRDREAHGTPEQPCETRVSRHKHPTSQTSTRKHNTRCSHKH
ncbi:hypothetical protein Taro_001167 [Colocasia esculenta]|uniref:Uncharacterized protein n=1 Tax=Colocasia esculenta TaxID=4460 RepID=A0A843TDZ1_COLES|nr:hypothetical protein [Colocasia esculenta]